MLQHMLQHTLTLPSAVTIFFIITGIHQTLRKVLREDKWTIEHDYPPLSSIRTRFGWTSFRDGLLSARNPHL